MKLKTLLLACAVTAVMLPFSARAQLVREDGVKSIAGVLVPGSQEVAEWTFRSSGGEILFATLDAEIYTKRSGEHETAITAAEEGGGCEGASTPGLFYIEVADQNGTVCHAERPSPPPGWMLDPRIACKLPSTQAETSYILRVGLKTNSEEQLQPYYAFVLNLSMRGIAVTGTNIESAIARSSAGGF